MSSRLKGEIFTRIIKPHLGREKDIAPTDEYQLQHYRNSGDSELIGKVYNRYMHLVYGLCLKYLKNREESQDAVMSIYEHISIELLVTEVKHFKSWLYMVTKNHCLMILRKKNPEINTEVFMEYGEDMHLNEDKVKLEEDLNTLEKCMEELNSDQKACVQLFFLKKKSYQEIHEALGLEMKKIKSHIQNGKRNLKICLENKHVGREYK